jgi:dTDP-glucose pyrophosphorylase
MWGVIPAAGAARRIQPLAFSKELLPVCDDTVINPRRPRAVSEYIVERLLAGGASRLCFVIAPGKWDILEYYGGAAESVPICYAVQPQPIGFCDAIFRALPVIDRQEPVLVGLPDTIWFPADGLKSLSNERFSFLLFPVSRPDLFDVVVIDESGRVLDILVKHPSPSSHWIWGAFKLPGTVLQELFELWCARGKTDEYFGTLVNAWLKRGGIAYGVSSGACYFDVGTMDGYVDAMRSLREVASSAVAGETDGKRW